jgi:hypothetical protein
MANIFKRMWARLAGTKAPAEPDKKDWKTVGRSFRATDALGGEGPSYVRSADEGRPRH